MVSLDNDGFVKIYPGKTPYQQYYMKNPNLELSNMQKAAILNTDGSWRSAEPQPRWERKSQSNNYWRDTEMTYIARVRTDYSGIRHDTYNPLRRYNDRHILQSYGRGGHHSINTFAKRCDGSALKFTMLSDGYVYARKEVCHPGYCTSRARTFAISNPVGKTLGHKTMIYNKPEGSKVYTVQEYWMCSNPLVQVGSIWKANPLQVWKRLFQNVDRGGWAVESERINEGAWNDKCPPLDLNSTQQYRMPADILSRWGSNAAHGEPDKNLMAIRSDYASFDLYYFNIRDINVNG